MRLRRPGKRSTAVLAVAVVASGLLVAAATAEAKPSSPPPNPSAGQISAAQARKDALGAEVGRLAGQIAAAQTQLQTLQGEAELAEQKVAFAVYTEQSARAGEARAKAQVAKASRTVELAHTQFVRYLQASYMTGTSDTSTGALLTAQNPTELLQQTTLERYVAENKVDAIGTLQTATVAKSNADAVAQRATLRAEQATANAQTQKLAADSAVSAAQIQETSLQQTLATNQTQLTNAQSALSILNHQHAQFVAYQVEQAKLAAARRAAARAAQLAAEQAAARRRAAQHNGNGSGGSSGGGGGYTAPPPVSSSGGWTAAKGQYAAQRALSELGVPYAWAGGGASGPSYGVCDPGAGAPNDCHVIGFDCSGLAMYAWGPYLSMDHYALLQYSEAGSYHPPVSVGSLRPGDLLFYSLNGSVSGIHHVAIYIGNGQIVQAPYSGAYVEVSSMYDPGPIFGATRPLT